MSQKTEATAASDKPFTVIELKRLLPNSQGGFWFTVYYRTYTGIRLCGMLVPAKDELDAFIRGNKILNKRKRNTDILMAVNAARRANKKKEQTYAQGQDQGNI